MLKSFSVENYRNLKIRDLKPNKINILIGPNNSGKSNFIDALSFLSNLVLRGKDSDGTVFLNELSKRGWDDLLDRQAQRPNHIDLKWIIESNTDGPDLCYQFRFMIPDRQGSLPPSGYYISTERLSNSEPYGGNRKPFEFFSCHDEVLGKGWFSGNVRGNVKRVQLDVDPAETVFNQIDKLLNSDKFRVDTYPSFKGASEQVKSFFNRFYAYSSTELDLNKVRQPVDIQLYNRFLRVDAANFVNVISYLDDMYNDFLDVYSMRIRELIPGFKRLLIQNPKETQRSLILDIGNQRYKLSEMSDGTIKALILALLLWSPEKTTLLSLDEPELNLHPAWLKIVSGWMIKSNSPQQLFVSTHSPDLLDGFTESFRRGDINLYSFSLQDEETLQLVTPEQVDEHLQEGWELGDLYRVGHPDLGGWPW